MTHPSLLAPHGAALANVKPVTFPVIDLSQLEHSMSRPQVIRDIGNACHKHGCFQVVNHGIQRPIIKGALEAAASFFELPYETKAEFASDDLRKPIRYGEGFMNDDSRERAFLKLYAYPLGNWIQSWPLAPEEYRERMGIYAKEVRKVALQVTDAIMESLGLGKAYMGEKFDEGMQLINTNSYSKYSGADQEVGLAPHTDFGFVSILIQNCNGLQVFNDIDGSGKSWKEAPEGLPNSLHVHIGDHLEVLSNGRYKSLLHRAVLNRHPRISIVSIHGLSMEEKVATPKELVDEQYPKKYKESSFLDFLNYICSRETTGKNYLDSLRITES